MINNDMDVFEGGFKREPSAGLLEHLFGKICSVSTITHACPMLARLFPPVPPVSQIFFHFQSTFIAWCPDTRSVHGLHGGCTLLLMDGLHIKKSAVLYVDSVTNSVSEPWRTEFVVCSWGVRNCLPPQSASYDLWLLSQVWSRWGMRISTSKFETVVSSG